MIRELTAWIHLFSNSPSRELTNYGRQILSLIMYVMLTYASEMPRNARCHRAPPAYALHNRAANVASGTVT